MVPIVLESIAILWYCKISKYKVLQYLLQKFSSIAKSSAKYEGIAKSTVNSIAKSFAKSIAKFQSIA